MSELSGFRVAVLATDGFEDSELTEPVKAVREAGAQVTSHAPWELVSAGLVRGRTLTGYHSIQDDIKNAGGRWVDREVVEDGNWVSSRQPSDIPAFNRALLRLFARSLAASHP